MPIIFQVGLVNVVLNVRLHLLIKTKGNEVYGSISYRNIKQGSSYIVEVWNNLCVYSPWNKEKHIQHQISDLLSSNRMPPSIPRITGSSEPATARPLQVTSSPVQSHTVARTVLSCAMPWLSATLRTTVYSPLSSTVAKFRTIPVSERGKFTLEALPSRSDQQYNSQQLKHVVLLSKLVSPGNDHLTG